MPAGVRSALTVTVLVALLLVGLVWGWTAVTAPVPESAPLEKCVPTEVPKGTDVGPSQVLVSVLNASTREGLAGRTMQMFVDEGFVAGTRGNAPDGTKVRRAEIWAADPKSPAVQLVRSRLGKKTKVVDKEAPGLGVVVVVGDGFKKLRKGKPAVAAASDVTICSPPT